MIGKIMIEYIDCIYVEVDLNESGLLYSLAI